MKHIIFPVRKKELDILRAGDRVEISGTIYVARDAAHQRLIGVLNKNKDLPVDLKGALIYYLGPTPTPPGKVIGSCGPTTSSRMDSMTVPLLQCGLKGMMGKGRRNAEVIAGCKDYGAVYFITYGGCGAYLNSFVKESEIVAYADLGPEAVYRLKVERFPALVGIDTHGNDFYQMCEKEYNKHSV